MNTHALKSLLALAALLPLTHAWAAERTDSHSALDGTWQLARPQPMLIPAGGGEVPFTQAGRERYEANKAAAAKGDFEFDPTASICSSPGAPRIMAAPQRMRLLVRPTLVTLLFEWNGLFRPIDMHSERRALPPIGTNLVYANRAQQDLLYGTMMGKSYGRWEGKTLVIESDGFSEQKLLDNLLPNSEELRLIERIRLVDRNTLEDRITITDPQMYSAPWDTVITYKRRPNEAFEEYVCLDHLRAGETIWPR